MLNALVLIDFQVGFEDPAWGTRNNPMAETKARDLLDHWRQTGGQIAHIRHVSTDPSSPLHPKNGQAEFLPLLTPSPGEVTFEKSVNSAFIGTGLQAHLEQIGASRLTICGLTTPHCVSTTCRMAANLGFDVTLAHDACAAFSGNADSSWNKGPQMSAEDIHTSAVSHLHGEFVQALAVRDILRDHSV